MKAIRKDALLGKCALCKMGVFNNDSWINITSINVEGNWVCGECLVELEVPANEAKKAYSREKTTNKKDKDKVKNTYNVTVDPATGKLKRGKL